MGQTVMLKIIANATAGNFGAIVPAVVFTRPFEMSLSTLPPQDQKTSCSPEKHKQARGQSH